MRRTALIVTLVTLLAAPSAHAVVGGNPVPDGKYPFVANIDIGNAAGCSGSLVGPTWVITAGHCAAVSGITGVPLPGSLPPSSFTVTLGTVHADGTGGQQHSVKSVHVDPDYAATNGTGRDVTLLELSDPSKITPIQVLAPGDAGLWAPGKPLAIAGFGTTSENGSAPDTMQEAVVPRVSDAACAQDYSDTRPVVGDAFDPKTALCAGLPGGGVDTCEGDSGGPIMAAVSGSTPADRLVGATSYGEGCARAGTPGVYARLGEGPVKAFVSGLVPGAYATDAAAAPKPCPRVTLKVSRKARSVTVNGTRVKIRKHRVRLSRFLARAGKVRLKIVVRLKGGRRHVVHRTYTGCSPA